MSRPSNDTLFIFAAVIAFLLAAFFAGGWWVFDRSGGQAEAWAFVGVAAFILAKKT